MIDAKDTFYLMLRDRVAALNPSRTVAVRGVVRPGVLVDENELAIGEVFPDVFRLRWTGVKVDTLSPLPLVAMTCEIAYATAGTAANAGMDRGRLLTQMDGELSLALRTAPQNTAKVSYPAAASAPVPLATNVFWGDLVFGAVKTTAEMVQRVATVEVFGYEEAGE